MSDIGAIRQGLADALGAVAGNDFQRSAYLLSNPTLPTVMIYQGEETFDLSFGPTGLDGIDFVARAVVPFTSDVGAQKMLDEFRAGSGDRSFKQALEADLTLGGACRNLQVKSASADTVYGFGQGQSMGIGCEFRISVFA